MIAFTLGGGAIADRLGRRPVMLAADAVRCAAQGALAVALYLGHPRLWLFVTAALAVGAGNAFFQPALAGLPVQLAPRERLGDANALLAAVQPAAQVAGPALAGMLIAATGPATVVATDAASYAISAVALAMVRFPSAGQIRSRSLLADLADGWAEFSSRAWLWIDTVQFALFNLLTWGPYLVLGPVLARDYLGGARAWGMIMACYGGGAILGGLLALGRRPRRPLVVPPWRRSASRSRRSRWPCTCPLWQWRAVRCWPGWAPRWAARSGRPSRSSRCPRGRCPAWRRSTWSARSRSARSRSPRPARWRPRSVPVPCSGSVPPGRRSARSSSWPCPPSAA